MVYFNKLVKYIYLFFTILSLMFFTIQRYLTNNYEHFFNYIILTLFIYVLFITTEYIYIKKIKFLPKNIFYISALFFFVANSLGELNNFYEKIPQLDNILHLISGIIITFIIINLYDYYMNKFFNLKNTKNKHYISFLIIVSALSSISFSVFWEFYELSADLISGSNMQDGLILSTSTSYNEIAPYVQKDNRVMDKALLDTMNDQLLATMGSTVASSITYVYYKKRNIIIFPLIESKRVLKKE